MTPTLNVTHRAGDPCPPDMFVVTPPEAFRGATFQRDVEVSTTGRPYVVYYDGGQHPHAPAIYLDLDPDIQCVVDGGGLCVLDINRTPEIFAIDAA